MSAISLNGYNETKCCIELINIQLWHNIKTVNSQWDYVSLFFVGLIVFGVALGL